MGLFRDKEDIKTIKDLEKHIEYLRNIIELKDFQIHNLRETLYFLKEKNTRKTTRKTVEKRKK